jgi:hypothetical protein
VALGAGAAASVTTAVAGAASALAVVACAESVSPTVVSVSATVVSVVAIVVRVSPTVDSGVSTVVGASPAATVDGATVDGATVDGATVVELSLPGVVDVVEVVVVVVVVVDSSPSAPDATPPRNGIAESTAMSGIIQRNRWLNRGASVVISRSFSVGGHKEVQIRGTPFRPESGGMPRWTSGC